MTTQTTQSKQYDIRNARTADAGAILALLEASDLPTVGVVDALSGFLVAESNGTIVAVVGVEPCSSEFALLRSTAVHPAWRNHGLGRKLVERAIASARAERIEALYLLTTTAEDYFPSFGFVRVARESVPESVRATDEFRSACPASAVAMALSLSQAAT